MLSSLPPEIILEVLSYLSPKDLARVSQSCRALAHHAFDDRLWANLVNVNLPSPIEDPGLFPTFRRLYIAHAPYWFIPKHRIWFADNEHTGNLILARYDNRRGVIEAYRVIADRGRPILRLWTLHPDVLIPTFDPQILLWLDDPVLFLKDHDPTSQVGTGEPWEAERRMPMQAEAHHVFSSLVLRHKDTTGIVHPEGLWPPSTIPTDNRIARDVVTQSHTAESSSEVADFAFGIRRWALSRTLVSETRDHRVITYATLDPSLYTPTNEKPYQGIWVGDYNAHGCEFLLFIQRDPSDTGTNQILSWPANEHILEAENANQDFFPASTLEAIKLTGDPNVPRGELSFKADDIGTGGLIRIAEEEPFNGARVVHCLGHVAGRGFHDGK